MVRLYKDGDDTALEKLITAFNPFLLKWLSVVKHATVNIKDTDTVKFVSMFKCSSLVEFKSSVSCKLYYMTDDDMYGELLVMFIDSVERYVDNGTVFFQGYLKQTFLYKLYRWVNDAIKKDVMYAPRYSDTELLEYDNREGDPYHIITRCLDDRERNILTSVFIDGMSREEVAKYYNVTTVHLSSIIAGAKKKIAAEMDAKSY
jgi:hypothetical protein